MSTREVTLSVNGKAVKVNDFVQKMIVNVINSIIVDLKGADIKQPISISVDGEDIEITTGGNSVDTNPFVGDFSWNTNILLQFLIGKNKERCSIPILLIYMDNYIPLFYYSIGQE